MSNYSNYPEPVEIKKMIEEFEIYLIMEAISFSSLSQLSKSNKYRILPLLGEDLHTVFDRYEEKLTEIIEDCNATDKQIMFFAIGNKMAARIELEVKRYQSIQQETTNLTSDDIDQEIVSFMQNLSEDNIESELELVEQHVDEYEEEWVKRNGFNDA